MSRRFHGEDKASIRIDGQTILERTHGLLASIFDEVILVTNDFSPYLHHDLMMAADIHPVRSSLTGIHAGLFTVSAPFAFITACDTPYLSKALVRHLASLASPNHDVVIPKTSAGYEPLCAIYKKDCVERAAHRLSQGQYKILDMIRRLRVREVPETILKKFDPELMSFFNINRPADLEKAGRLQPDAAGTN